MKFRLSTYSKLQFGLTICIAAAIAFSGFACSNSDESSGSLAAADKEANSINVNAFEGGSGGGRGQFRGPRGIAVDAAGNFYVADTGNARVQKFSAKGEFLQFFGKAGTGAGEMREPNGIAVDAAGNLYVTDALNHRLLKYRADGAFEYQSSGPTSAFYGPRDVAVEPNGSLYVLDQGGARVVKLDAEGKAIAEWGRKGAGEGEFDDPTGLTLAAERLYIADKQNGRVQALDLNGKFLKQWSVPEWQQELWLYPDVVYDEQAGRLYATSGVNNEVLVFDDQGKRLESLKPAAPAKLNNPSALFLVDTKDTKNLYVLNSGGAGVSVIDLGKKQ